MKNISIAFALIAALSVCFMSCKKESTNQTGTQVSQQINITNFAVYLFDPIDTATEIGAYNDPDGSGPIAPNIGGIALKKNRLYDVTFQIEDATDPNKVVNIHSMIKSNGKDYKLCIDNPLGITVTATDSDGSLPIGLENDLMTSSSTGTSNLNFTIKYQKGVKDGQCTPGTIYYSCKIPVTVY